MLCNLTKNDGKYSSAHVVFVDIENQKILFQLRSKYMENGGDQWGFIGGLRDRNETVSSKTVRREVMEEFSDQIDITQFDILFKYKCGSAINYVVDGSGLSKVNITGYQKTKDELGNIKEHNTPYGHKWISVDDVRKMLYQNEKIKGKKLWKVVHNIVKILVPLEN